MPLSKRRRTDRGVFFFNSIEELLSDKRIGTVSWLQLVFQKFRRRWRCDAVFYSAGTRLCHFLRCTSFWPLVLLDETDDVLRRPPAVVWVEVPRGRVEVDRGVPLDRKVGRDIVCSAILTKPKGLTGVCKAWWKHDHITPQKKGGRGLSHYHLCNDNIFVALHWDCNFLQDRGQLPAMGTPRSIKFDQYCEEKVMLSMMS